jgi:hypothetical protein
MSEILLIKGENGIRIKDTDSEEVLAKVECGTLLKCNILSKRSSLFHRKYFALIKFAFENWTPEEKTFKGQVVQKEINRFRKDIQILAGFYDVVVNLKGEVRYESKSISFNSMEQDEFEKLYSAVIDVILSRVLSQYARKELDKVVDELLVRFS